MTSDLLIPREDDAGTLTVTVVASSSRSGVLLVAEAGGTGKPGLLECAYVNGSIYVDNTSDVPELGKTVVVETLKG